MYGPVGGRWKVRVGGDDGTFDAKYLKYSTIPYTTFLAQLRGHWADLALDCTFAGASKPNTSFWRSCGGTGLI